MSGEKVYYLLNADRQTYASKTPGKFGGHRGRTIYGRLDCPVALRALAKGGYRAGRVFFEDEAAAIAARYRPCAICMPEKYWLWKLGDLRTRI